MVQKYVDISVLQDNKTILLRVATLYFAVRMQCVVFQSLQKPLLVPHEVRDKGIAHVVSATAARICEVVIRRWTMTMTESTPFQRALMQVKMACQFQYQVWKDRCALQDYKMH